MSKRKLPTPKRMMACEITDESVGVLQTMEGSTTFGINFRRKHEDGGNGEMEYLKFCCSACFMTFFVRCIQAMRDYEELTGTPLVRATVGLVSQTDIPQTNTAGDFKQ